MRARVDAERTSWRIPPQAQAASGTRPARTSLTRPRPPGRRGPGSVGPLPPPLPPPWPFAPRPAVRPSFSALAPRAAPEPEPTSPEDAWEATFGGPPPRWLDPDRPTRALKRRWMPPRLWTALKQKVASADASGEAPTVAASLALADIWHPGATWARTDAYWLVFWGQALASIREFAALGPAERIQASRILAPVGRLLGVDSGVELLRAIASAMSRGQPLDHVESCAELIGAQFRTMGAGMPETPEATGDAHVATSHQVRDLVTTLIAKESLAKTGFSCEAGVFVAAVAARTCRPLAERVPPLLPLQAEDPAASVLRPWFDALIDLGYRGSSLSAQGVVTRIEAWPEATLTDFVHWLDTL